MRPLHLLSLMLASGTVLAMVPLASAQAFAASNVVVRPEALAQGVFLAPERGVADVPLHVIVAIQNIGAFCLGQASVRYSVVSAPPYANVILNPANDVVDFPLLAVAPTDSQDQVRTFTTHAIVSTTKDAPAMEDGLYRIKAELQTPAFTGGCDIAPSSGMGQFTIKNDFVPGITAQRTSTPDGEGSLEVLVTNEANGPTLVTANVTGPAGAWTGTPPVLHLAPRSDIERGGQFQGVMRVPYDLNGAAGADFVVSVSGAYDGVGCPVAPMTVDVPFHVDGLGADASPASPADMRDLPALPAAGPLVLVLGFALAILLHRRAA